MTRKNAFMDKFAAENKGTSAATVLPTKKTANLPQKNMKSPDNPLTKPRMVRKTVSVDQIQPNPRNRFSMERDEDFLDLLNGIKANGQPTEDIVCQPADENGIYYIISGERRWMALQEAEIETTPVKILPSRVSGADEIAEIVNYNMGRRGNYPYDIPLSLYDYYRELEAQGITDKDEQLEMARKHINISVDRTLRNYHKLAQLPFEILKMGANKLLLRDDGLALYSAMSDENTTKFADEAIAKLLEINDQDVPKEEKALACKSAISEMKKKIAQKKKREEAKAEPQAMSLIRKMSKITSIGSYKLPTKKKDKDDLMQQIQTNIAFLQKLQEELEDTME